MCKSTTATACVGSEGQQSQQEQQASGEGGVGVGADVGSSSTPGEAPVTEVQSGTLKNSAPLGEDIEEEEPGARVFVDAARASLPALASGDFEIWERAHQ